MVNILLYYSVMILLVPILYCYTSADYRELSQHQGEQSSLQYLMDRCANLGPIFLTFRNRQFMTELSGRSYTMY